MPKQLKKSNVPNAEAIRCLKEDVNFALVCSLASQRIASSLFSIGFYRVAGAANSMKVEFQFKDPRIHYDRSKLILAVHVTNDDEETIKEVNLSRMSYKPAFPWFITTVNWRNEGLLSDALTKDNTNDFLGRDYIKEIKFVMKDDATVDFSVSAENRHNKDMKFYASFNIPFEGLLRLSGEYDTLIQLAMEALAKDDSCIDTTKLATESNKWGRS